MNFTRLKIYPKRSSLVGLFSVLILGAIYTSPALAAPLALETPVDCELGKNCFLQQMADMDTGNNISDPFCGSASYDGHKGTDIRLLSMADIERNVPVIAAADGIVKAIRDGEPDKLVLTGKDQEAIKNKECGNGLVIDHGNNIETQYCHMKRGSILVSKGQSLKAGDQLGYVGASGLAQFPHLHLSLRQNGKDMDPFTGKALGEECGAPLSGSWWKNQDLAQATADAEILKTGLTGAPVKHDQLVVTGGPANATTSDQAVVGWAWFANLRQGDQIFMALTGPNGLVVENTTKPLDRNKASWSGFIGKRQAPAKGPYDFQIQILRDEKTLKTHHSSFTVE